MLEKSIKVCYGTKFSQKIPYIIRVRVTDLSSISEEKYHDSHISPIHWCSIESWKSRVSINVETNFIVPVTLFKGLCIKRSVFLWY